MQRILSLVGSNTIGEKLAPALVLQYLRSNNINSLVLNKTAIDVERVITGQSGEQPISVEILSHGSSTAFKALKDQKADVGMSSRPIKQHEIDALMPIYGNMAGHRSEHILALDGLAVIVNPANPISELTSEAIAKLFSGEIKNWQDVGGDDIPVKLFARDVNSGTWDSFRSMVLKPFNYDLSGSAERFESSTELSDKVFKTPGGIGFIGLPYVRQAKSLAVAASKDTLPIYPTSFTVSTEDYPLSRRLYLYIPSAIDNSWANGFIEFVLSDEGQNIVKSMDLVPQNISLGQPSSQLIMPDGYEGLPGIANRLSINFRFDTGGNDLDVKARRDIKRLVNFLEEGQKRQVYLVGFTDNIGDEATNYLLSKKRAKSVANELYKYGVSVNGVLGLGPQSPVASNDTQLGRIKNRRVEIWLY